MFARTAPMPATLTKIPMNLVVLASPDAMPARGHSPTEDLDRLAVQQTGATASDKHADNEGAVGELRARDEPKQKVTDHGDCQSGSEDGAAGITARETGGDARRQDHRQSERQHCYPGGDWCVSVGVLQKQRQEEHHHLRAVAVSNH